MSESHGPIAGNGAYLLVIFPSLCFIFFCFFIFYFFIFHSSLIILIFIFSFFFSLLGLTLLIVFLAFFFLKSFYFCFYIIILWFHGIRILYG